MRIAVMGSGGIGGYFGGLLGKAGADVTLIARGDHLAAIREMGLKVRSALGDFEVRVRATDDPAAVGQADLILFTVKGYDTEEAAGRMRPLVGPASSVLCLQNGVDNEAKLEAVFGPRAVLGGVAHILSTVAAPGVIHQTAGPRTIKFGEMDGTRTARLETILRLLTGAGINATISGQIVVDLWEKFVFICAHGGVTALARLGVGEILGCPETAALYQGVMEEIVAVARASGVPLPQDAIERVLAFARSLQPAMRSSLAHDLEQGKRLEVETLPGAVIRYGARVGVPTPLNGVIYACLKPYHLRAVAARRA
ncbi:MAG: 2-dehydropantoate 2-reductase [candidate division NC10 bacterium]|nr:2-dehydropantoate 2-reductase [candidate division NC10 bacterium]